MSRQGRLNLTIFLLIVAVVGMVFLDYRYFTKRTEDFVTTHAYLNAWNKTEGTDAATDGGTVEDGGSAEENHPFSGMFSDLMDGLSE